MLIESKDTKGTVDALTNKHSFRLKGTSPISYHLGCDYGGDEDGTLHFVPRKHIDNMENFILTCSGQNPN